MNRPSKREQFKRRAPRQPVVPANRAQFAGPAIERPAPRRPEIDPERSWIDELRAQVAADKVARQAELKRRLS